MIRSALRSVGSVIAGFSVALALVVAIEAVSAVFHPFPADTDPTDYEACLAHVARIPAWLLMAVTVGWGLTALAAAWLATRFGRRHPAHGVVVGAVLFLAAGTNLLMLPYPLWFKAANLVVIPIAIYWGGRMAAKRRNDPSPVQI